MAHRVAGRKSPLIRRPVLLSPPGYCCSPGPLQARRAWGVPARQFGTWPDIQSVPGQENLSPGGGAIRRARCGSNRRCQP